MTRALVLAWGLVLAALAGCAGPGPRLSSTTPFSRSVLPDGRVENRYDFDADGVVDYAEVLDADGRIRLLRFDDDGDGVPDADVPLAGAGAAATPAAAGSDSSLTEGAAGSPVRELVIILDSIPHTLVAEAWDAGRLRYFPRPARVVGSFPVMTDPCLVEFFGLKSCPGVEAAFYDGERLTDGLETYLREGNAPWAAFVDYRLEPGKRGYAYLFPDEWYYHELREIQARFLRSDTQQFMAYVMGTSALGSQRGRSGHQLALIALDRLCRALLYETRGRVRITLMSDHGHYVEGNRRISLAEHLQAVGYRLSSTLDRGNDVIVPEWGSVSCVAIYSKEAERAARDALGFDGVELAVYPRGDAVVVLSREGAATIERAADGFRYAAARGDPLELAGILASLARRGLIRPDGSVADDVLRDATLEHAYPDAVYRLWRAFNGLFDHPPGALLSLADGWYCGDETFAQLVPMDGVHGNLRTESSCGFAMTMGGALPPVLRMKDLRAALVSAGVYIDAPEAAQR